MTSISAPTLLFTSRPQFENRLRTAGRDLASQREREGERERGRVVGVYQRLLKGPTSRVTADITAHKAAQRNIDESHRQTRDIWSA